MGIKDKKTCAVCGDKAGIFTRIKLNDGLLCGDCVKKCSEHLEDFDEKTAEEIKAHLTYRERNKHSSMLSYFSPTLSLGDYEVLKIDEKNKYWLVTTPKRFAEENPDVFYLSQITGCEVIEKRELLTPEQSAEFKASPPKATTKIKQKITRSAQKPPEYGYWFYVRISVRHPWFSEIVIRLNKYIIREQNQTEFLSCERLSSLIVNTLNELSDSE
ncbi:hypothetical protein AGMMS50284_3980 [Clostridia bacterium]|nr:hypothetical protein AGMMS50284_3980 [Clostridia bacterium]